jgi:hypothetical protein
MACWSFLPPFCRCTNRPICPAGHPSQQVIDSPPAKLDFVLSWTQSVRAQPGAFDHAATVDLPEQRSGGDFGKHQPGFEGSDWAGVVCPPVGNGDLGAFTLRVRLGARDEHLQPILGPGYVFQVEPDKLGAAQRTGESQQKQRTVACAVRSRAPGRSVPQADTSFRTSAVVMAAARRDGLPCLRPIPRSVSRIADAWCRGGGRQRHTHGLWRQLDGARSASHNAHQQPPDRPRPPRVLRASRRNRAGRTRPWIMPRRVV